MIEEYVLKRGSMVNISTINIEPASWEKPVEVFEKSYMLECSYQTELESIIALCRTEKDEMTAHHITKLLEK